MLIVSSAGAQADASAWKSYTVKGEKFSVDLPSLPAMEYRIIRMFSQRERLEISIGSYADGVVYTVHVFENLSPRESLDSFIRSQKNKGHTWSTTSERKLTLDGVNGKAFTFDKTDGSVQFFSKGDRLFQFAALGAAENDVRVTKFFSSISLVDRKDGIDISDRPSPPLAASASKRDAPEQIFTLKEVDKRVQIGMKIEPSYTDAARQNEIKGVVVLKCMFAADGTVNDIRVVTGLPYGLTERSIAVARKIKFIPAIKDGKYVSVWIQLEYNFNLY